MVWGCGEAPPAPTAVPEAQRVGAGSKGQSEMDVLPVRPSPDSVVAVPTAAPPADAGPVQPVQPDEDPPLPPPAVVKARVFSACQESRLLGCDVLYVRMLGSDPDLCVQLVMDNCNANARQALAVVLPLSWRLSSGSASTDRACDLRDYDPKSQPALTASGKITWSARGRVISGLDIDVSLNVESPPGSKVPAQIDVTTDSPIPSVDTCD